MNKIFSVVEFSTTTFQSIFLRVLFSSLVWQCCFLLRSFDSKYLALYQLFRKHRVVTFLSEPSLLVQVHVVFIASLFSTEVVTKSNSADLG